jgi:hypothetical protein
MASTHALRWRCLLYRTTVSNFNALLGVAAVVDIREVFSCDFESFGVDAEGAAAVLE